jgi:hypothetical protein
MANYNSFACSSGIYEAKCPGDIFSIWFKVIIFASPGRHTLPLLIKTL